MAIEVTHLDQVEVWLEASGVGAENYGVTVESLTQQGVPATSIHVVGEGVGPVLRTPAFESEIVVYLRAGWIAPGAIAALIATMNRFPGAGVIYGDSSFVNGGGVRPPAASLSWLRGTDYLGPVVAFRATLVQEDQATHAAARALDWTLRAIDVGHQLVAMPMVLGITKATNQPRPDATAALVAAVERHLLRRKIEASVESVDPSVRRVRYALADIPLVSIIMMINDARATVAGRERWLALEALRSVIDGTAYQRIEFILVIEKSTPDAIVAEVKSLLAGTASTLFHQSDAVVAAGLINSAIEHANGEFVAVLGCRTELASPKWIQDMLGLAMQPDVGVVGGTLFSEHGSVEHAGFIHEGGKVSSAGRGMSFGMHDSSSTLRVDHEVSAVSGECLVARRSVLLQLGGYSPALSLSMAGLDLSLKARVEGLKAVCSAHSRWYLFRTDEEDSAVDLRTIGERWGSRLQVELYSRALI